jgi:hypothetical protein
MGAASAAFIRRGAAPGMNNCPENTTRRLETAATIAKPTFVG